MSAIKARQRSAINEVRAVSLVKPDHQAHFIAHRIPFEPLCSRLYDADSRTGRGF